MSCQPLRLTVPSHPRSIIAAPEESVTAKRTGSEPGLLMWICDPSAHQIRPAGAPSGAAGGVRRAPDPANICVVVWLGVSIEPPAPARESQTYPRPLSFGGIPIVTAPPPSVHASPEWPL